MHSMHNCRSSADIVTRYESSYGMMSSKTKDFIQKICYRKAASVDMTQFGFINDRKLHPVNMLMKPLREQLEKICGKSNCHTMITRKTSPIHAGRKKSKKRRAKTADHSDKIVPKNIEFDIIKLLKLRRKKKAQELATAS